MNSSSLDGEREAVVLEFGIDTEKVNRFSNKQFDELIELFDTHVFQESGRALQQHMLWARFVNAETVSIRCFRDMAENVQLAVLQEKLPCRINLRDE